MSEKQTIESFWSKVAVGPLDACWEWQRATNNTGYGTVGWHGKTYVAHRVAAWTLGVVESPSAPSRKTDPWHVLHVCDNRKCCNPTHWFLGSQTDNMIDMYQKNRHVVYRGDTHANAKLTARQVIRIRRLYATGKYRQVDLAERYGVSQVCVSLIVRGETYL